MNKPFLVWLIVIAQLIYRSDCDHMNNQQSKLRIHSGTASNEALPYQVLIFVLADHSGVVLSRQCGGSLITVNYVLTSATCLYEAFVAQMIFGALYSDRVGPSQVVMSSTLIKSHPGYDHAEFHKNIGLVKLPEPIKLVPNVISLVTLPRKSKESPNYEGVWAKVSGWGERTVWDSPHVILNELWVVVIPDDECKKIYGSKPSTFCGNGDLNGNPCDGDRGSPLMFQTDPNIQIGIVSNGPFLCNMTEPYMYTKVSDYLDWIELNSDYRQK